MEIDVGISEYLSSHSGITGIIKQRYSDFIVHEISLEDEVVHLSSLTYTEDQSASLENEDSDPILSDEQLQKISEVDQNVAEEYMIEAGDKASRTKIHECIKKLYPKLNSETKDVNTTKYIVINRKSDVKKLRFSGNYCKFVLYKENKNTMEAIEYISKLLRVKSNIFSFAGTKDKRAITTQLVTVQRMHPSRLSSLNRALKNVALGNFQFCDNPLKLGDLNGNCFQIILRHLEGPEDKVNECMTLLKQNGFINYFGMQRFGTTEVCNSEVGSCILKCNWTEAIELILKPRNEDNELLTKCRKVWDETHDPSRALSALKNYSCFERKLLEGLQKYSKNNHVAAFSMIPRSMRLMYLHSYQSLVWNKVVSMRIHQFGTLVLVGDLFQSEGSNHVDTVTEENVPSVKITDVVHPLPGFDVKYPSNIVKNWYEDILKADNLHESSFRHRVREYSLPGGYRKIITRPSECSWSLLSYDDYQVPLLSTDMDILKGKHLEVRNSGDGKFKALKLELKLPTSSYATMAIREIIRQDTSSQHQSTLNVT